MDCKKYAQILIDYSVNLKKGEKAVINAPVAALPLAEEVYKQVLKKGAYPSLNLSLDNQNEIFFQNAQRHHYDYASEVKKYEAQKADVFIRIMAETNTKALSAVDPKKQIRLMKTYRPIKDIILKKRWVLCLYPTNAYAQDAGMSLSEFEKFVESALFLNKKNSIAEWKKLHKTQENIIKKLKGADKIRIVSKDTDLTLSVKNRKFINSSGTANMPSGEIFTSPLETSAEGYIKYSFPSCVNGREVDGIYLEFKKGKVVNAKADRGGKYLKEILQTDEGARRIGEFAFGLNYGIKRATKNILFDEKIGGTIHIALGSSYEETGGKNKSAVHWDMIKDLKRDGAVYVDGKLFFKGGRK